MANPFEFSSDQLKEIAARWERTKPDRERASKAKSAGKITGIDTPKRLAKYVNRITAQAKSAMGDHPEMITRLPGHLRSIVNDNPISPEEVAGGIKAKDLALLHERVIETEDFLSTFFFELGLAAISAVARIDIKVGLERGTATGFLVSPSLMLTNWHVFKQADWTTESKAEFDYQRDRNGSDMPVQTFEFEPDLFVNDEKLDFALVAVKPRNITGSAKLSSFGFLPLIGEEGKIAVTKPVNIVQHPLGRHKEVVIRNNELSALPEGDMDGFAHYLADTDRGSSGSPVFNDRWEVIALHHSGVPKTDKNGQWLTINNTPWDGHSDDLAWSGNEGIRISRIVNHLKEVRPTLPDRMVALVDELLLYSQSLKPGPERAASAEAPPELNETKTASTFSAGPVTINIVINSDRQSPLQVDGVTVTEARSRRSGEVPRTGFNENFLGMPVRMPRLMDEKRGRLAKLIGGGNKLDYVHYSVLMNEDRRLAYVSAVNYDSDAQFTVTSEDSPDWSFDERMKEIYQADDRHYKGKHNPLDRGHLTRRQDAAWGHSPEEARAGNDGTYVWTNCAPQHETFNQSKKSVDQELWGELENHVTAQAKAGLKKLSIFNGPVFGEQDTVFGGLRVPRAYWKVIAYRKTDSSLGAVAFAIDQINFVKDLKDLSEAQFDVAQFDVRQVKMSYLTTVTGLDFGFLEAADPMMEATSIFESGLTDRKLKSVNDIRF